MRYYIINSEGKEVSFDLSILPSENNSKKFQVQKGTNVVGQFYVKNLAGKSYISENNQTWNKLTRLSSKDNLVNVNESLSVYRGFKPSGLSGANAGELVAEMPGKVIKVMTAEGAVVHEGDTLLILEAMKMENEIKAGIGGVIKSVNVEEGQVLESGHLMIEIEE